MRAAQAVVFFLEEKKNTPPLAAFPTPPQNDNSECVFRNSQKKKGFGEPPHSPREAVGTGSSQSQHPEHARVSK